MPIVQDTTPATNDPRWIFLRVSRINLAISGVGVSAALGMLALAPLPIWLRCALAAAFLAAFVWDLHLILLKNRYSVGAFYLFDLDAAPGAAGMVDQQQPAKLGIRVRYALALISPAPREAEGVVLTGAYVSPWFTALRYRLPHDPRWRKWWPHIIPIWPDTMATESFRAVRVALKWK